MNVEFEKSLSKVFPFSSSAIVLVACSFGAPNLKSCTPEIDEQDSVDETWLEGGAMAVDPDTEKVFVLPSIPYSPERMKTLYAIDPDGPGTTLVTDFDGYEDPRILFPRDSVLLMVHRDQRDTLLVFDPHTLVETMRVDTDALYSNARLSPGRRWLVAKNHQHDDHYHHIIDTEDMHKENIPPPNTSFYVRWLHSSETLLALTTFRDEDHLHNLRVLLWSVEDLADAGWATGPDGFWSHATIDVIVHDVWIERDRYSNSAFVDVSPDDSIAVIAVHQSRYPDPVLYRLLILDLENGTTSFLDDAGGPVHFTPDGSTIISYRYVDDGAGGTVPALLLIDADTLSSELVDVPLDRPHAFLDDSPYYIVSHESNHLIVIGRRTTEESGDRQRVYLFYDLDTGEVTEIPDSPVSIRDFIHRRGHDELWLVSWAGGLHRLGFVDAIIEPVEYLYHPEHISFLPSRDRIVIDDVLSNRYSIFDPGTAEEAGWVVVH